MWSSSEQMRIIIVSIILVTVVFLDQNKLVNTRTNDEVIIRMKSLDNNNVTEEEKGIISIDKGQYKKYHIYMESPFFCGFWF